MHRVLSLFSMLLFLHSAELLCQQKIIDEILAVVGDKKILLSDIEKQYKQLIDQGVKPADDLRCQIFEEFLSQKLMLNQAEIDSIEVTDAETELQLDQRLKFFINQVGSEENLIKHFENKSILEIKEDIRDAIKEQILIERMRSDIIGNISVTPSEVKSFYKSLPKDSIPYVNSEIEISQIVTYPSTSEQAIYDVREKLLNLRQRIINGERFGTLAVLYSEDGSASKGGDIGWANKADLDPEYAKAAFGLKKGAVSKIVKSSFGYHIIELIDRTEDRVHTRHILMKPVISIEAKEQAKSRLDSIIRLIRLDSLTFSQAALRFSQDEDTRMNGGQVINETTGNSKFELNNFDTRDYLVIKNLNIGEISDPYESTDKHGKIIFKAVILKNRTNPHVANLKEDYDLLKQMTMYNKQSEIVDNWVKEKIESTYIRLNDDYKNCKFRISGWLK
jgi:peptidyl-prolyl cis-trans isomerase SurA